jgi:hypothetical protein
LDFQKKALFSPAKNVTPDTLQSLGVLAIGLGFLLIGLGGFSTYHASQKLQHEAELREAERKGEYDTQLLSLMLKNQQLQDRAEERQAVAAAPAEPEPSPPLTSFYRPPSPPPPTFPQEGAPSQPVPPQPPEPVGEAPPDVGASPSEPPADWREPESLEPEVPSRYISVRQHEVIADTLRAHGPHTVMIESSYGDQVSRAFAEEIASAFDDAGWEVRGVEEHRGLPLAAGVTVSAASFPPQQETRAVYEALLSAGIAVTQQLNPKQRVSETVVLVGAPL